MVQKVKFDFNLATMVEGQKSDIPVYIWCRVPHHPSQIGHIGFSKIHHRYPPWPIFENTAQLGIPKSYSDHSSFLLSRGSSPKFTHRFLMHVRQYITFIIEPTLRKLHLYIKVLLTYILKQHVKDSKSNNFTLIYIFLLYSNYMDDY